MKPEKIIDGRVYEISVGKTPDGKAKKAVVTVIEKNLITKTWLCQSEEGKQVKVKDPARFLKEVKPKEEKAEAAPPKAAKGPKRQAEPKPEATVPEPMVSDEVRESLRKAALTAQRKAKVAAQALETGIGHVTREDVDTAERDANAAREKAKAAGVTFGGTSGRSNGQMGGKVAAYQVLLDEGRPMRAKELCELAHQRGYCELTGATPEATIAAAIATDIKVNGENSRFKRVDAGLFAANENFAGKGE